MTELIQTLNSIADKYRGAQGPWLEAETPLEQDSIRRFTQAIMDRDPSYFDAEYANRSKFGTVVAPTLFPVHAFRPRTTQDDPLAVLQTEPNADGSSGNDGVFFGLSPLQSPLKRLLNGGNEIEFYRNLAIGDRCRARARYADIQVKQGNAGPMLVVCIETVFENQREQLLLINRQTLIWR